MREDKVKEWFFAWFNSEWDEYNGIFIVEIARKSKNSMEFQLFNGIATRRLKV